MRAPLLSRLDGGEAQTVVLYGTSLTEGPWSSMFGGWLSRRYGERARVINSCQPGKASRTGLRLLDSCVLRHRPDFVTLEFAVNDATRVYTPDSEDFGISLTESRANLEALVGRIRSALPACQILLQTMNPGWDAPNGRRSASLRPQLAEYYQGYREAAQALGLPLADHFAAWTTLREADEDLFRRCVPDGIHPVELGSETVTFPGLLRALGEP